MASMTHMHHVVAAHTIDYRHHAFQPLALCFALGFERHTRRARASGSKSWRSTSGSES